MAYDIIFAISAALVLLVIIAGSFILILGIAYTHYPYGLPWKTRLGRILKGARERMRK